MSDQEIYIIIIIIISIGPNSDDMSAWDRDGNFARRDVLKFPGEWNFDRADPRRPTRARRARGPRGHLLRGPEQRAVDAAHAAADASTAELASLQLPRAAPRKGRRELQGRRFSSSLEPARRDAPRARGGS